MGDLNSKKAQDEIYKTIEVIAREIVKSLPYCYLQDGTITSRNKDGSYNVKINDSESVLKKFDKDDSRVYQIGDVVWLIIRNNITTFRYIIGKKN